jgi:hypothetical protein
LALSGQKKTSLAKTARIPFLAEKRRNLFTPESGMTSFPPKSVPFFVEICCFHAVMWHYGLRCI